MNIDQQVNGNENRRTANQNRAYDRWDRLSAKIDSLCLIGQLCREGKTVYYFFPAGGKYKESNSEVEIMDYIIKQGYVR